MKNSRGFTLIEVLVVASIISLFSTVVTSSVSSGRQKTYNTFKREAMNQYVVAFELFHTINGRYPSPSSWSMFGFNCVTSSQCGYLDPVGLMEGVGVGEMDAQLITEVGSVLKNAPIFKILKSDVTGNQVLAPIYKCSSYINGTCRALDLSWYEEGNTNCIGGATKSYNGVSTLCIYQFTSS